MNSKVIATSFRSLLLVTACRSPEALEWVPPLPGEIDEKVAEVLPIGSFAVSGEYVTATRTVTKIEGYVNYGTLADGEDCEADYMLTNVTNGNAEDPSIANLDHVIHPKRTCLVP